LSEGLGRVYKSENFQSLTMQSGGHKFILLQVQIRAYKVTRGPHYDGDATMAITEPY